MTASTTTTSNTATVNKWQTRPSHIGAFCLDGVPRKSKANQHHGGGDDSNIWMGCHYEAAVGPYGRALPTEPNSQPFAFDPWFQACLTIQTQLLPVAQQQLQMNSDSYLFGKIRRPDALTFVQTVDALQRDFVPWINQQVRPLGFRVDAMTTTTTTRLTASGKNSNKKGKPRQVLVLRLTSLAVLSASRVMTPKRARPSLARTRGERSDSVLLGYPTPAKRRQGSSRRILARQTSTSSVNSPSVQSSKRSITRQTSVNSLHSSASSLGGSSRRLMARQTSAKSLKSPQSSASKSMMARQTSAGSPNSVGARWNLNSPPTVWPVAPARPNTARAHMNDVLQQLQQQHQWKHQQQLLRQNQQQLQYSPSHARATIAAAMLKKQQQQQQQQQQKLSPKAQQPKKQVLRQRSPKQVSPKQQLSPPRPKPQGTVTPRTNAPVLPCAPNLQAVNDAVCTNVIASNNHDNGKSEKIIAPKREPLKITIMEENKALPPSKLMTLVDEVIDELHNSTTLHASNASLSLDAVFSPPSPRKSPNKSKRSSSKLMSPSKSPALMSKGEIQKTAIPPLYRSEKSLKIPTEIGGKKLKKTNKTRTKKKSSTLSKLATQIEEISIKAKKKDLNGSTQSLDLEQIATPSKTKTKTKKVLKKSPSTASLKEKKTKTVGNSRPTSPTQTGTTTTIKTRGSKATIKTKGSKTSDGTKKKVTRKMTNEIRRKRLERLGESENTDFYCSWEYDSDDDWTNATEATLEVSNGSSGNLGLSASSLNIKGSVC